ncbi:MAG TPA: prolipoprotein diacylglyceryl transferase [Longimicrobiales bacterium]|nr:prolipoprotein diacylglyceryl transferase [Longimicrobiales bacterium]
MYPVLFEIGGFEVTSFGVMIFLSFLTGAWILSLQLERRGMDPEIAWEVLAATAIAGVVGAKLYYMGLHWRDFVADPVGELTSRAGLVWYGGLIGGVTAFYWEAARRKLPIATMFDGAAPALGLAYAVGRVGCFLVGDDYGMPTDSGIGVAFPQGSPPSTAGYFRSLGVEVDAALPDTAVLAVHPTQLYEVAGGLAMFAILWQLSKRALRPGQLFGAFLVLYGIERFAVEFVRAKGDRFVFGLTTSQIASFAALAVGVWLWTRLPGRPASAARAPAPEEAAV